MHRVEFGSEEWAALFRFARSAFRYECLQHYSVPAEYDARQEFARTGRVPLYPAKQAWLAAIAAAGDRGAVMSRVHAITVPVTGYVEWELASYAANVEAGEDIRLLPARGQWPRWLPARDFWLFDDRVVARLGYDRDGAPTGARVTRNPLTVALARRTRDRLMAASVPYAEYTRRPAGAPAAT